MKSLQQKSGTISCSFRIHDWCFICTR